MMMCVCQSLKLTESEKLQVQIQAYLDNVFDVGALLEDAENRGGVLEHVDELQEHNSQVSDTHCTHTVSFIQITHLKNAINYSMTLSVTSECVGMLSCCVMSCCVVFL